MKEKKKSVRELFWFFWLNIFSLPPSNRQQLSTADGKFLTYSAGSAISVYFLCLHIVPRLAVDNGKLSSVPGDIPL